MLDETQLQLSLRFALQPPSIGPMQRTMCAEIGGGGGGGAKGVVRNKGGVSRRRWERAAAAADRWALMQSW